MFKDTLYRYKAQVVGVYDGDSVTLLVDLGFKMGFEIKCRLYGIDTPEIREERPEGLVAKDRVKELILDKEVFIETYKDRTGKYGRYLATIYVEIEDKWVNINQLLIDEGLASVY